VWVFQTFSGFSGLTLLKGSHILITQMFQNLVSGYSSDSTYRKKEEKDQPQDPPLQTPAGTESGIA
jgi:hypothetical protein